MKLSVGEFQYLNELRCLLLYDNILNNIVLIDITLDMVTVLLQGDGQL